MDEFKAKVAAVLEAWKGIPEDARPKFNDAAGPLVDALRGLGAYVESGALESISTGAAPEAAASAASSDNVEKKAGDVCTLPDGQEGILNEELVCVEKPAAV